MKKRRKYSRIVSSAAGLKRTMAWKVFATFIKQRDRYICITCRKKGNNAGHFRQASGYLNTFWDEHNVNCQCISCNLFLSGNLAIYSIKLREKYGENIDKELIKKSLKIKQGYTRQELKQIAKEYREKIEQI